MRSGQGKRCRSPWWIWYASLSFGIAVLPGAHYVGAQSPQPTEQQVESSTPVTDTRGPRESIPKQLPLPAAPATAPTAPSAPFKFDAKADGEKSTLLMEVEIFEVGANSSAEKELTLWLEKQTTGSNSQAFKQASNHTSKHYTSAYAIGETVASDLAVAGEFVLSKQVPEASPLDHTKTREVSILSKLPYINRLYRRESNSLSDGPVVQASAQSVSDSKRLQFVTPASEAVDSFVTSLNKLDTVKALSAPKLICQSEQTAMVSVKENTSAEPSAGFSLSLKPIELRHGNMLILDYQKSTTTKAKLDSATTTTINRNTKPATFQTKLTGFSTSVIFGQSLVVVTRGVEENASHEVVVIKCTKRDQPN